ncbi:MAG: ATP-dependent zinc metalloprotease FtsH [Eubacterium sp.]|nr:ATP-dependent zinc metalloprotease FtsH [Eubacterium sp.]MDD6684350.1 ATP-dependent zinc metalloprotease FtsH [Lachnospiraceae bacterium]
MESKRGWRIYLIMMIGLIIVFMIVPNIFSRTDVVSRKQYENYLKNDEVTEAEVVQNQEVPTGAVLFTLKDGTEGRIYVSDVEQAQDELDNYGITYELRNVSHDSNLLTVALPIIVGILLVVVLLSMMGRTTGGGANARMMDFGKSRAQMTRDSKIRFSDVAGMAEEKEDLEEIVDFLRNPAKYTKLGARIPKGIILVGQPGTGKTLLAKAVAGEAGVPFFSISGSDFVEMFVGVGASRVRDLFAEAKKNAPCIIFIDEIDAVGRRRGTGMGGGHDEREQTLNQLLVEMDGFGVNEGIIVMAATNRVDILDPAILRPGRFDRKVMVSLPDIRGREAILRVHARNKALGDDVNLKQIAQTTAGFSGADLENLMNEAAIRAAKEGHSYMSQEDIKESFIKVGIGTEKKSHVISEKEKRITAYHETGHAILFHVLPDMDPVYTISVIPTGPGAAGYTMPQPENDNMFSTRGKMMQQIMVDLGGRAAEEIIFDDITTGASQDIKQATNTARSMVTKYGMSSRLGLVNYGEDSEEVFIGRDWGHTKSYSENVASAIDEEVKEIIENCHAQARRLIEEHRYVLDTCAQRLMEKEKLNRMEFEAIFAEEAEAKAGDK